MVHDLAVLTWKKLRLDKLEQKVILGKLNRSISIYEANHSKLLSKGHFEEHQRSFSELSGEEVQSYKKSYKYAQHLHQKDITVEKDVELVESGHTFLLKTIQLLIEHYVLVNPIIENVIRAEVWVEAEKISFLKLCLETFIHHIQALIWYCEYHS